jgi:mannose-1-phosphate guanylyltransferase / mannose-6-phosphate isomerase
MLVPVILSGGNGSRLWPVSREAFPKPFLRPNDSFSLLQTTYKRAANLPQVTQIITVTNAEYYYQSKMEINKLPRLVQKKKFNFLLEPISRNTAPAITVAALFAQELTDPTAILLILPADHIVVNQAKFNQCVDHAVALAQQNLLVTFGIIPNKAEVGYGYIQCSDPYDERDAYHVKRFHEKPTEKEAKFFIEQGNYLWNAGIFCFSAQTFLAAIKQHKPELYLNISTCWRLSMAKSSIQKKSSDKLHLDQQSFSRLDKISIDYALLEKAQNIAVIQANFGWRDIGSWDSFNNLLKPDQHGNCIRGKALLQNSTGTTVYNQNPEKQRIIAGLGLKNLIIVDTPDALLIIDRAQSQNVKQLVAELKANGHEYYSTHETIYRPWGSYTVIDQGPNYKIKQISVNTGCSLSLQMHKYRSEHWVVIQGTATVQNNQAHFILQEHESTFIPVGHQHRLSNFTEKTLIIIELQLGAYLGEDDITRFEDNYDRIDPLYEKQANTC